MMAGPGDMPARGDDPGVGDLDVLLRGLGADVDAALAGGAMRCGPYMLLDEIGAGGFGEVHVGVRDDAAARRVAVKVLKRGVDTRDVLRRFEMEQRALARIDHPCVAAILDAGTTDDGRPWFAMPLLDGDPVTIACDDEGSPLSDRLRLMTMICDAVQAAHVQGKVLTDATKGVLLDINASAFKFWLPADRGLDLHSFAAATAVALTAPITLPDGFRRTIVATTRAAPKVRGS